MKNLKKMTTIGAVVLAMGVTSATGFAASIYKTPAEAAAGLTGRTVESVIAERQETNKTYGTIAGNLDEFKKENIEMKKDNLEVQVSEGRITQEKADTIIKKVEENQENCDGTGSEKIGQNEGAKFGSNGAGQGLGNSNRSQGKGQGQGGMKLQDGSCYTPAE